jgi:hypothetical protein
MEYRLEVVERDGRLLFHVTDGPVALVGSKLTRDEAESAGYNSRRVG